MVRRIKKRPSLSFYSMRRFFIDLSQTIPDFAGLPLRSAKVSIFIGYAALGATYRKWGADSSSIPLHGGGARFSKNVLNNQAMDSYSRR